MLSWLHVPGVTVTHGDPSASRPPLSTSPNLGMGSPVTLAQAQQAVPFRIREPADPGIAEPAEVLLDRTPSAVTAVTLVYPPGTGLPRAAETGAGALLSEFRGTFDNVIFQKIVYSVPGARRTTVRGAAALWVSGPQDLILGAGDSAPFSARRSANSLLWVRAGVTYRLEAEVSLTRAVEIASSVP